MKLKLHRVLFIITHYYVVFRVLISIYPGCSHRFIHSSIYSSINDIFRQAHCNVPIHRSNVNLINFIILSIKCQASHFQSPFTTTRSLVPWPVTLINIVTSTNDISLSLFHLTYISCGLSIKDFPLYDF